MCMMTPTISLSLSFISPLLSSLFPLLPSPLLPSRLSSAQPAPIILLKEGTDTSQGKPQIISNINACEVVVDAIASTLGPRGMDKLIVDGHGKRTRDNRVCTCVLEPSLSSSSLSDPPFSKARLPSPMTVPPS